MVDKKELLNGTSGIIPAASMPQQGMQMKMNVQNGVLTIQMERQIAWLQFRKDDLVKFIQELANCANAM